MNGTEKLDVLDLLIAVLMDYEKRLSCHVDRLERVEKRLNRKLY